MSRSTMDMEQFGTPHYYWYCAMCISLALLVHAMFGSSKKPGPNLPPGPWPLPLIGSVHHLLSGQPHHAMRDLSLRHGPLMLLRIFEHVVIVLSSAEAAGEMFRDTAFEQRPSCPAMDEQYARHGKGIVFAPYGDHWRLLRRVLVTELLSAQRVESFRRIREEEAASLVSSLAAASSSSSPPGQLANIDEHLAVFVTDSVVRAIFGDRVPDRAGLLKSLDKALDFSSLFDMRDLFPSSRLAWMLPRNGKAARMRVEVVRHMEDILRLHVERRAAGGQAAGDEKADDMVDVLLRIQNEGSTGVSLTHGIIMDMLIDVFVAALKATTTTLGWAMAELMANPRVMEKLQSEIRGVLAGQDRVREVALRDLGYLRAVIKETLRLHPLIPLVPRSCTEDRKIQGYNVPEGTILVANVWAISRDPKYWQDPDRFVPERFEAEHAFNCTGSDFEFTPFGSGRRICPAITFSQANIEVALASLLYHFDWALPMGVRPEELDMADSCGIEVRRKAELLLHPIPRIPPVDKSYL